MTRFEVALGDALFTVNIDFEKSWPAKLWRDTTHFHVDSEVHIVFDGCASLEIGEKDVEMRAGDVCLLVPRSSHYPKSYSDTLKKTNFSFSLSKNYSHDRSGNAFSEYVYYTNIFKSVSEYFVINDSELFSTVKTLLEEDYSEENEHRYVVLLSVFFITLAKRIKENHAPYQESAVRGISESENSSRQRRIVEEFFQTRYNEEVGIEDLAKTLCLSVPQTHRVVKKVFDSGFKKTLMKQRIEHACMLIKQGELTLSEIAFQSGYSSYNGFLSAFKGYMRKSPKEYEKNVRH